MDANTLLLVTVVVTALAFDFTNGFHDTANAMATSIATGALFGRMAAAWVVTLPAAGAVGAVAYAVANGIGGTAGVSVVFVAALIFVGSIYQMSRRAPVDHTNVNAEWTGTVTPEREAVPA
jgi:phosphate/sulfate permease